MMDRTKRCYLYIRVSTDKQEEEGYSLPEQEERLRAEAEKKGFQVVDLFADRGVSGKNIEDRDEYKKMMEKIKADAESVGYVFVADLTRFGRNMADTINGMEDMGQYDTYLYSVKEGLDSSDPQNKAMLQMFAVWAEMERSSINSRTMAGRMQKAKQGGWNGGFAPYGYMLYKEKPTDTGELRIDETEAPVIREIFRLYIHEGMGCRRIANYLNASGYEKKIRQNGTVDRFSEHFVRKVIENPVYCGKIAFGRRKTEKIKGTRNKTHVIVQEDFPIYDGQHEAIISYDEWLQAMARKQAFGGKKQKIHDLEHEHLLSGIVVCPVCGDRMLPNLNRKAKKDGTHYKTIFYYQCRHKRMMDGHVCTFRRSIRQEKLDAEVEQLIIEAYMTEGFIESMQERLGGHIEEESVKKRIARLEETKQEKEVAKRKLAEQIDRLDVKDKSYDAKYADYQARLDKFYEEIDDIEDDISSEQTRLDTAYMQQGSRENAVRVLKYIQDHFDEIDQHAKKAIYQEMLDRVELFKEPLPDGRWVKSVHFRFPVLIEGQEDKDWYATDLPDGWNLETQDERMVLLGVSRTWR